MKENVFLLLFVLAVLLGFAFGIGRFPQAVSSQRISYVLDPQGEQEVGRVVVDPVPVPVSASGLALSRIAVEIAKPGGWTVFREAVVSSENENPPQKGRWVQCLTYSNYHGGVRVSSTISMCRSVPEDH